MKTGIGKLLGWLSLAAIFSFNASATTYYVNVGNNAPAAPFTDWSIAATNIQDAIDVSSNGDLILVTNGVYKTGGRIVYGSLTNRVVINKAVTVRSFNGPAVTAIQGNKVYSFANFLNGSVSVRCVYMTNSSMLIGFTLTNGTTGANQFEGDPHQLNGGGVYCEPNGGAMISNCVLLANTAFDSGGGAYYGALINCTLTNNNAYGGGGGAFGGSLSNCVVSFNSTGGGWNTGASGGGVSQATLDSCSISGNVAITGGGTASCTLDQCMIASNTATGFSSSGIGGGVVNSRLNRCILVGNSAFYAGGGAAGSDLNSCILSGNSVLYSNSITGGGGGGGAASSFLTNCLIYNNSSTNQGGGVWSGNLFRCTIASNKAWFKGGGTKDSSLNNCIVYYNSALDSPNCNGGTLTYTCTTPFSGGTGNITNEPAFLNLVAGNYHLSAASPCINSGNNAFVSVANDLDGNLRIVGGTVDIGAYEFQSPASTLSYAWAQQYGLPTDGTADGADTDGDGMNNWQEWKSSTVPTNAASVLQLASPSNSLSGMIVTWQSVGGVNYYLQRGTNLAAQPVFTSIQSNLVGQVGTTSYTDTTATNATPYFYRVGVQ